MQQTLLDAVIDDGHGAGNDPGAAPAPYVAAQIIDDGDAVALEDAMGGRTRFHALWLRDNGHDEASRDPVSGQRRISARDIPTNSRIASAQIDERSALRCVFEPDQRALSFAGEWLAAHAYDRPREDPHGNFEAGVQTWDASLGNAVPSTDFEAARSDRVVLARWLAAIRRLGFARMTGGPVESGALMRVAALFGYVRETNYGHWFEVRTQVNPTNLAYTSLGLQAHTDNPYRDPAPTMQILYCLENSAEGGDNTVVDGFRVVERLREESPGGFELLSRHCARFEYTGSAGVRLQARRPIIELAPDGEVIAVRFNNRSIAAVTDVPYQHMAGWLAAYRRFGELVDDPAMAVGFKLAPGECFVVDNRRVLHARTGYSGAGTRWLQGCYPDIDGLRSTLAAIEHETGENF